MNKFLVCVAAVVVALLTAVSGFANSEGGLDIGYKAEPVEMITLYGKQWYIDQIGTYTEDKYADLVSAICLLSNLQYAGLPATGTDDSEGGSVNELLLILDILDYEYELIDDNNTKTILLSEDISLRLTEENGFIESIDLCLNGFHDASGRPVMIHLPLVITQ